MRTRRSAWCCLVAAVAVAAMCWASTGSALASGGSDTAPRLLAPGAELGAAVTVERVADGHALAVAPAPQGSVSGIAPVVVDDARVRVVATGHLLEVAPKTSPPLR